MESVGSRLKKVRLEKGISLEDVQKKTRIRLNVLKAIEGDGITDLSPIYVKGFLKIYCRFLGVDLNDYLPNYKETKASLRQAAPPKEKRDDLELKPLPLRFSKELKARIIVVLIILVSSIVVFNVGKSIASRRKMRLAQEATPLVIPPKAQKNKAQASVKTLKSQNTPKTATQGVASLKPKVVAAKEVSHEVMPEVKKETPVSVPVKKEVSAGITLGMRPRENCWVSLKVDGKLVFQRVLEKGRFESWQAKERIELSLGDAAAVDLEFNGRVIPPLGRKGRPIKNILFTKDGQVTVPQ